MIPEEFVVYILYSKKYSKKYVGFTSDLLNRIASHNQFSNKGFTFRYRPWVVVHVEFYLTKKLAMDREKWLKSGQGRQWIKDFIEIH